MSDKKKVNRFKGAGSITITKKKINDALDKAEKTKGKNRAYFKEVAKIYQNELKELKKQYPDAGVKQGPKKPTSKLGTLMNRRAKNLPKGDITKKMNMGGVMKNRGGTFKGTY
jgi:DNA primase catalytic subunit